MVQRNGSVTIAGTQGHFVHEDEQSALWEVRVSPSRLTRILELCGGSSLEVETPSGVYRALARKWWVLPAGGELLVRIALEKGVPA